MEEPLRKRLTLLLLEMIRELPPPQGLAIRLHIAKIKGAWGWCDIKETKTRGRHFLITISKEAPYSIARDTLFHEYAHVLAWFDSDEDHGASWGYWFSRVYRMMIDEK